MKTNRRTRGARRRPQPDQLIRTRPTTVRRFAPVPFVGSLTRTMPPAVIADYEGFATSGVTWSTTNLEGIDALFPAIGSGSAPTRMDYFADYVHVVFSGADLPAANVDVICPPLRFSCDAPAAGGDAWAFPFADPDPLPWSLDSGALDSWLPSGGSHVTPSPPNRFRLNWSGVLPGVVSYGISGQTTPFVDAATYDILGFGWDKPYPPATVRNYQVTPAYMRLLRNGVDAVGLIDRTTLIDNIETVANNNAGVNGHLYNGLGIFKNPLLFTAPDLVWDTWPDPSLHAGSSSPYGGSYASSRLPTPPTFSLGDRFELDVWYSIRIRNPQAGRNSPLLTHSAGAWGFAFGFLNDSSGSDDPSVGWRYPGRAVLYGQKFNDGFDPDADTYSVEFPASYPWHIGDGSTGSHKLITDAANEQTATIDSRGIRASGVIQSGTYAGESWSLNIWWTGELCYLQLSGPSDVLSLPGGGGPVERFTNQSYRPTSSMDYVDTWSHDDLGTLLDDPAGVFNETGSTNFLPYYGLSTSPRDPLPVPLPWPADITVVRTVQ